MVTWVRCLYRYDRLKGVEAKEMQVEIENKFGLQERKRVPLVVNDQVMLFFKVQFPCRSTDELVLHRPCNLLSGILVASISK